VVFVGSVLQVAQVLMHNHRPDLIGNGVALLVFAAVAVAWVAVPRTIEASRS
jgi:hypothetical protein